MTGLSPYQRPNQKWTCGCADANMDGASPCPGPDGSGKCGRSLPNGMPACVPRRSVRNRLIRLVGLSLAVLIAVLAIALSHPHWEEFLSPGPLVQGHSRSVACDACHANAPANPAQLAETAFQHKDLATNGRKCIECHDMGGQPFRLHGVTPADLAVRKPDHPAHNDAPGQIACSTCHMEHRGRLAQLNDGGHCEDCHSAQAGSHSEFGKWPFYRRTGVIFDHASHFMDHFEKNKADAPADCLGCHDVDGRKEVALRPYDTACAACHDKQISGGERATSAGLPIFALPGLDMDTLRERKVPLGEWPAEAEANLSPFLAMLLATDDQARGDIARFRKLDTLDLSQASTEDIAAVARVAWRIKQVIANGITSGPEAILAPLTKNVASKPGLGGMLSRDVLVGMQRDWFPHLEDELARHKAGKETAMPPKLPKAAKPVVKVVPAAAPQATMSQDDILGGDDIPIAAPMPAKPQPEVAATGVGKGLDMEGWAKLGGWYRKDFGASYRPVAHQDPFLRAWLDASGPKAATDSAAAAVFDQLTRKNTPGQCSKCHATTVSAEGAKRLEWLPGPTVKTRTLARLTRFDHQPHLAGMGKKGCLTCHPAIAFPAYLDSYRAPNSDNAFVADFGPIKRGQCTECHADGLVKNSCVTCHGYHAEGTLRPKDQSISAE